MPDVDEMCSAARWLLPDVAPLESSLPVALVYDRAPGGQGGDADDVGCEAQRGADLVAHGGRECCLVGPGFGHDLAAQGVLVVDPAHDEAKAGDAGDPAQRRSRLSRMEEQSPDLHRLAEPAEDACE